MVTLVFNVNDGEVEGTDVSGLTVAAVADSPKVMSDGNRRLGVFIDAGASDEQAAKLGAVFSGGLGGPMEALSPLVGENLGVERASIVVREDGLRHSIRIGEAVDFEIEDVVPFGVETGEPARLTGHLPPGWFRADDRARDAIENRRVRDQVRRELGLLDFELLLGGVSVASSAPAVEDRSDRSELGAALAALRARSGVVLLLFALAAAAWWSTADRMAGMDGGPGTDLGALGWFLGVWAVMMAAMMFPSLAPTVTLYSKMTRGRGPSRPLLFASAYLFVWGAAGLCAYGLFALGRSLFGGNLAWHMG